MKLVIMSHDRASGEHRLLSALPFPSRDEALAEVSRLLDAGEVDASDELLLVDLDAALPVVLFAPRVPAPAEPPPVEIPAPPALTLVPPPTEELSPEVPVVADAALDAAVEGAVLVEPAVGDAPDEAPAVGVGPVEEPAPMSLGDFTFGEEVAESGGADAIVAEPLGVVGFPADVPAPAETPAEVDIPADAVPMTEYAALVPEPVPVTVTLPVDLGAAVPEEAPSAAEASSPPLPEDPFGQDVPVWAEAAAAFTDGLPVLDEREAGAQVPETETEAASEDAFAMSAPATFPEPLVPAAPPVVGDALPTGTADLAAALAAVLPQQDEPAAEDTFGPILVPVPDPVAPVSAQPVPDAVTTAVDIPEYLAETPSVASTEAPDAEAAPQWPWDVPEAVLDDADSADADDDIGLDAAIAAATHEPEPDPSTSADATPEDGAAGHDAATAPADVAPFPGNAEGDPAGDSTAVAVAASIPDAGPSSAGPSPALTSGAAVSPAVALADAPAPMEAAGSVAVPEPGLPLGTAEVAPQVAESRYEPGELDLTGYTCDDCVYVNTCPNQHGKAPAECGSFQWRSM